MEIPRLTAASTSPVRRDVTIIPVASKMPSESLRVSRPVWGEPRASAHPQRIDLDAHRVALAAQRSADLGQEQGLRERPAVPAGGTDQ